ncbi:MAG: Crp/Fnr family transcriptional regulator [Bosea sp. (in: a-proteobacteria)]
MRNDPRQLVSLLSANPFFGCLAREALEKIAVICRHRHLAARQVLFLKGDPSDGLYAIRSGQIRIGSTDDQGQHMTLNVIGAGDVFGEIALLDGQSRTADAVALEETDLVFLPRQDFLGLLAREPAISQQVITLLCARLRDVIGRMEETAFLPAAERLARRILLLAIDYGQEVHASQEELASLTGVTRETVNRQLQRWKRDGVIALGRGRLMIRDLAEFRRLAQMPSQSETR